MKSKIAILVITILLFSCNNATDSNDPDNPNNENTTPGITVVNNSGINFCELFITTSQSVTWGEELLKGKLILNGKELFIPFNFDSNYTYDIYTEDLNKNVGIIQDFDTNQKRIVINNDMISMFKPTANDLHFNLIDSSELVAGFSSKFNIVGFDNKGNEYKGEVYKECLGTTLFLGHTALRFLETTTASSSFPGESIFSSITSYNSGDENNFFLYGFNNNNKITTVSEPTLLPKTATIGESGSVGVYTDSNNNRTIVNWSLEDAGNDTALLNMRYTTWFTQEQYSRNITEIKTINKQGTVLKFYTMTSKTNVDELLILHKVMKERIKPIIHLY